MDHQIHLVEEYAMPASSSLFRIDRPVYARPGRGDNMDWCSRSCELHACCELHHAPKKEPDGRMAHMACATR